jgi:hypothetical protein
MVVLGGGRKGLGVNLIQGQWTSTPIAQMLRRSSRNRVARLRDQVIYRTGAARCHSEAQGTMESVWDAAAAQPRSGEVGAEMED